MGKWLVSTVGVLLVTMGAVVAQDAPVRNPTPLPGSGYFDCPYVNYFDADCPQLQPRVPDANAAIPESPPEDAELRSGQDIPVVPRDGPLDIEQIRKLFPLFPKSSLAPDTPSLYHRLLLDPTPELARLYVRWHAERMARIEKVQALIRMAGNEFLAENRMEAGP